MEFPNIKTFYSFVGAGLRFFNTSPAYPITIEEDGYTFASNPKTRRYLGFEIGLAQAILVSYGNVLQTTSSLIAANLNAGYTYALGPSWGLSSQINISIGFGYSSVSVLATSLTGLLGINFFF